MRTNSADMDNTGKDQTSTQSESRLSLKVGSKYRLKKDSQTVTITDKIEKEEEVSLFFGDVKLVKRFQIFGEGLREEPYTASMWFFEDGRSVTGKEEFNLIEFLGMCNQNEGEDTHA